MAHLQLSDVKKSYGAATVLHGISLEIADGEFVVLVGPSGCGKSTLLRMIAGLEEVSGGEIHIGARLVNALEPKDRDIAMVFQNYALYPHMSVYRNMAYGLQIARVAPEEIARRVTQAASLLGLQEVLERRPAQLSGGQRQRVAMGRAMVREPAVFLFDEPLSNLDAQLRQQLRLELKRLHQRLRTTSIYVTHDQVEAMTLAERMVVMNAGRIEQIGTTNQIFNHPATRFVATFIGSPAMNLLQGSLDAGRKTFVLRDGLALKIDAPYPNQRTDLELGIRPEHLEIGASDWPFEVELIEPLGAEVLIHGTLGGQALILRQSAVRTPRLQERVGVGPRRDEGGHLHWFDARHGTRLTCA